MTGKAAVAVALQPDTTVDAAAKEKSFPFVIKKIMDIPPPKILEEGDDGKTSVSISVRKCEVFVRCSSEMEKNKKFQVPCSAYPHYKYAPITTQLRRIHVASFSFVFFFVQMIFLSCVFRPNNILSSSYRATETPRLSLTLTEGSLSRYNLYPHRNINGYDHRRPV